MEKRRRKNRKRRLLILLIALFFTTVMFATTTYAWFTANKTVTVSTLTVNVAAQNGIQISADGTNWKSIIQEADIMGVHNTTYRGSTNQIPESMEPVSTVGNIDTNGMMEMYYGTIATGRENSDVEGQYVLTAVKSTEAEGTVGKFIAFDMFLKVDAATDIYLTTNSGVRTTDDTDTGIKNASSISDIQNLNAGTSANKYIWEPNYDVHTAAAVAHARDTYNETTSETGATRIAYAGVKAPIALSDDVLVQTTTNSLDYITDYDDFFGSTTIAYATIAGFSTKQQIFSLQAGVTKVRVYMWIEGQDVDCENSASGGTITYDLQLTTDNS